MESQAAPDGRYLFGLSLPSVISLMEKLPSAGLCRSYAFKFEKPKEKEVRVLPVNSSGCARSEAFSRLRIRSLGAFKDGAEQHDGKVCQSFDPLLCCLQLALIGSLFVSHRPSPPPRVRIRAFRSPHCP